MLETLWIHYLSEVLKKKFSETQISRSRPTFGVEHEFFLLNSNGGLATYKESQKVFSHLANQTDSRVILDTNGRIAQINFEHTESKSYSVLKYEFSPHLLELAFGYSTRIELIEQRVNEIFNQVGLAINNAGLSIGDASILPLGDLSRDSLTMMDSKKRELHEGRKRRLAERGRSSLAANFPAFTAGTQIQVGGTKWWDNPGLVSRLYSTEPEYLFQSARGLKLSQLETAAIMEERFRRYEDVYIEKQLVGFPKFKEWTLTNWSSCLAEDLKVTLPTTGEEVRVLAEKVHDLSLIALKPGMATIEFRGCPSLPNCEQIILELKRRMKQFLDAANQMGRPDISESRETFRTLFTTNFFGECRTVGTNGRK